MTRATVAITAVLFLALLSEAGAGVDYLPDRNLLWVTDYPADFPCTPKLLARIDDAFGWDKVTYDDATQTCTVACNLWIGRNDGSQTWFQVGSAQRPTETLVVRGNVRVHSTWLIDEKTGTSHSTRNLVNRLTLGVRENPAIQSRLLIDNDGRLGHALMVGGPSGYGAKNGGGEICVYHGMIAPFGNVPIGASKGRTKSMVMGGQRRVELVNAAVRDVMGEAFGRHLSEGHFEGVRFERCGKALHGTYQKVVRGCTFRDCGVAIDGSTRFDLVLHNCVFTGNRRNWQLPYKHMVLIDCVVDDWDKGAYSAERATFAVSKRHVIVRVQDADGRPVKGAMVRTAPSTVPAAPTHDLNHAVTGADGCTPGRGKPGALLLSQLLIRPGEEKGAPHRQTTYSYMVEARSRSRGGRIDRLAPQTSWELITITLAESVQSEEEGR